MCLDHVTFSVTSNDFMQIYELRMNMEEMLIMKSSLFYEDGCLNECKTRLGTFQTCSAFKDVIAERKDSLLNTEASSLPSKQDAAQHRALPHQLKENLC